MAKESLIPWGSYLSYSAPHVAVIWLMQPLSIVQGIYAKYYGLSLSVIAVIVFVARLFDAVTDPIVGYYVDRRRDQAGSHKLFVLLGSLLFIASAYYLYSPHKNAGALYFTVWFMLLYLAFTLYEVAHLSWASSLARSSKEKSEIYSFRSVAGYLGAVIFYSIPFLPLFESRSITPKTLEFSVIVAVPFMVVFLIYCLKVTPGNTIPGSEISVSDDSSHNPRVGWQDGMVASKLSYSDFTTGLNLLKKCLCSNKPFLIFLGAYSFLMMATGMWFGLIFIYVDVYLGAGEQFAPMFMVAFLVGLICTPIWCQAANKIGKKNTWVAAVLLIMASFIMTAGLSPENVSASYLLTLKIVQTVGFSCVLLVTPAMLSEVIDYGTWQAGVDRTATYFSLYTFFTKSFGAGSAALALGIAGWYGFDASVQVQGQDQDSVFGLMLGIVWLPLGFAIVALIFIFCSPISASRHAIVQRRLAKRPSRRVGVTA